MTETYYDDLLKKGKYNQDYDDKFIIEHFDQFDKLKLLKSLKKNNSPLIEKLDFDWEDISSQKLTEKLAKKFKYDLDWEIITEKETLSALSKKFDD